MLGLRHSAHAVNSASMVVEVCHPLQQVVVLPRARQPDGDVRENVVSLVLAELEPGADLAHFRAKADDALSERVIARSHEVDAPRIRPSCFHGVHEVAQMGFDTRRLLEKAEIGEELRAGVVPGGSLSLILHPRGGDVALRAEHENRCSRAAAQEFEMIVRASEVTHERCDPPAAVVLWSDWQQGGAKAISLS